MVNLYSQSGELIGPRDEEELRDLIKAGLATVARNGHERAVYLKSESKQLSPPQHRLPGRRRPGIGYRGIDPAKSAAVDAILARRRLSVG